MELIVQVFVRHQNRRALDDLGKHRQRLALELRARAPPGYDIGLPVRQIHEEIAVIEAGLEQLIARRCVGSDLLSDLAATRIDERNYFHLVALAERTDASISTAR